MSDTTNNRFYREKAAVNITDEMVERAWAAIVGADVAAQCFHANIIRADLRTAMEAVGIPAQRQPVPADCVPIADLHAVVEIASRNEFAPQISRVKAWLSSLTSTVRCQRCGSSGDVFMLCAGCQSPLTANAKVTARAALMECASRCRYDGDLFHDQGNEARRDASWRAAEMAEAALSALPSTERGAV